MIPSEALRLINRALYQVRETKRTSDEIENGSDDIAEMVGASWLDIVKTTISSHPWYSAAKRASLEADPSATPPFDQDVVLPLPDDFLRVHFVQYGGRRIGYEEHKIVGRNLVTNAHEVDLAYVYYPLKGEEESDEDYESRTNDYIMGLIPSLRMALVYAMASEWVWVTTANSAHMTRVQEMFSNAQATGWYDIAVEVNNRNDSPPTFGSDSLIAPRFFPSG